jgi:hypothetical protein
MSDFVADSKLPTMIPLCVQNPEDSHAVAFDAIKNLVRKPARDQTAEAVAVTGRRSGCSASN